MRTIQTFLIKMLHAKNYMGCRFCSENNDKTQADYWKRMTVTQGDIDLEFILVLLNIFLVNQDYILTGAQKIRNLICSYLRFRKKGSRLKLEIWFWIYFLLFLYSQLPAWWRGSWKDRAGMRIITGIPNLLSVLFKGLYPYRCVAFSVRVWIFTYFPILWLFVIYPSP